MLTANQKRVLTGKEYDIESRRARTRAFNDVRSLGLVYSNSRELTPKGKQACAALKGDA